MIFLLEISSIRVYRSKMEVTRVTTRVAIVSATLTLAGPYYVKLARF